MKIYSSSLLMCLMVSTSLFANVKKVDKLDHNTTIPAQETNKKLALIPPTIKSLYTETLKENPEIKEYVLERQSLSTNTTDAALNHNETVNSLLQASKYEAELNNIQSFKNGMFYGFIIMLILLGFVSFIIFDEKLANLF